MTTATGAGESMHGGEREQQREGRAGRGEPRTREDLIAELSQLEQENSRLRRRVSELNAYATLAYRDALTGLRNRRYLDKRVAEEINRVRREPGQTLSVVLIDVDDFKQINDTHGHAVGDETLRWVAQFVESSVREHDICCRYAGDEFVIVLPHADRASCALLVERLRQRLATVQQRSGVKLGLSLGAATYGADGVTAGELLERADARMYDDKRCRKHGRGGGGMPWTTDGNGEGEHRAQLFGAMMWSGRRVRDGLAEQ